MRTFGSKKLRLSILLISAGTLGACGNFSKNVAADGASSGQLEWPAPHSVTPTHKGGTFPDVAQLRLIQAGMNKQQISQLIGYPHYNEGVAGVREWNYLFNFRVPNSDVVIECQLKVLFDNHKLSRSFYWQPESCPSVFNAPAVAAEPPKAVVQEPQTFTLAADSLFGFNKSARDDIRPNGREMLDDLARKIVAAGSGVTTITVTGYTDHLGTDAHNATLSQQRADTVKHYLERQGVASGAITAIGRGAADPVKQCAGGKSAEVIACLAPNRRVEVLVLGR